MDTIESKVSELNRLDFATDEKRKKIETVESEHYMTAVRDYNQAREKADVLRKEIFGHAIL